MNTHTYMHTHTQTHTHTHAHTLTHTHTHIHTNTNTHTQTESRLRALTDDATSDGERDAGVQLVDERFDLGQVLLTELLHPVPHGLSLQHNTVAV